MRNFETDLIRETGSYMSIIPFIDDDRISGDLKIAIKCNINSLKKWNHIGFENLVYRYYYVFREDI